MLWFVVCNKKSFEKRGREVQNTAHPRSYVSALSGGGYRRRRGINEKLTARKHERLTKES